MAKVCPNLPCVRKRIPAIPSKTMRKKITKNNPLFVGEGIEYETLQFANRDHVSWLYKGFTYALHVFTIKKLQAN